MDIGGGLRAVMTNRMSYSSCPSCRTDVQQPYIIHMGVCRWMGGDCWTRDLSPCTTLAFYVLLCFPCFSFTIRPTFRSVVRDRAKNGNCSLPLFNFSNFTILRDKEGEPCGHGCRLRGLTNYKKKENIHILLRLWQLW